MKQDQPDPAPKADARDLTEEGALALLANRDLQGKVIEELARSPEPMKSRRVLQAVIAHPRTPRHISLPRTRHLYTLELMMLALSPAVGADLKMAAEDVILSRLSDITAGERLTLAKRASTRIAAALLLDPEERVMQAALENGRLTESCVVRALQSPQANEAFVQRVCGHPRWSLQRDIRLALLRNPHTPLARVAHFAASLPANLLSSLLDGAKPEVKQELQAELRHRQARP